MRAMTMMSAALAALVLAHPGAAAAQDPVVVRSVDIALATPALGPAGPSARLLKAQWRYGGRSYCFYRYGWRGPGYYWCGYDRREGVGWGGEVGWNGWGRAYRDDCPRWRRYRSERRDDW